MIKRILPVAILALALAACSNDKPAETEEVNNTVEEVPMDEVPVENLALPPENLANAAEPAAPPPSFSQDEQMLDDADATGLTSRLPAEGGNETAPANE